MKKTEEERKRKIEVKNVQQARKKAKNFGINPGRGWSSRKINFIISKTKLENITPHQEWQLATIDGKNHYVPVALGSIKRNPDNTTVNAIPASGKRKSTMMLSEFPEQAPIIRFLYQAVTLKAPKAPDGTPSVAGAAPASDVQVSADVVPVVGAAITSIAEVQASAAVAVEAPVTRLALVICNRQYESGHLSHELAIKAFNLVNALRSKGYTVACEDFAMDLKSNELERRVETFFARIVGLIQGNPRQTIRAVIYYIGHGASTAARSSDKDALLYGVDDSPDRGTLPTSLSDCLKRCWETKPMTNPSYLLVALDCCRTPKALQPPPTSSRRWRSLCLGQCCDILFVCSWQEGLHRYTFY
eukprot:m.62323 g.62323  ORF g.62323 m.62323 type:complete len:359 (+) comp7131_c1_seq1:106-1182(+)